MIDVVHLQANGLGHIVADELEVGTANEVLDILLAAGEEVVHAQDLGDFGVGIFEFALDEARGATQTLGSLEEHTRGPHSHSLPGPQGSHKGGSPVVRNGESARR